LAASTFSKWRRVPAAAQQMADGQKGVAFQHARAGIAHNAADFSPRCRLITMGRAFRAGWPLFLIRAFFQTRLGVSQKLAAIRAQVIFDGAVRIAAAKADHRANCFDLVK